jgi:hypothetical protein
VRTTLPVLSENADYMHSGWNGTIYISKISLFLQYMLLCAAAVLFTARVTKHAASQVVHSCDLISLEDVMGELQLGPDGCTL